MPVNIADGAIVGPYCRAHDETAALLRKVMGPSAPPRPTSQGARGGFTGLLPPRR